MRAPSATGRLQIGASLLYRTIDAAGGESIPFLFLHGMGGDANQPLGCIGDAPPSRVISLNARGHGPSSDIALRDAAMTRAILTGRLVYDGTMAAPARGDVVVEDGRIVAVGCHSMATTPWTAQAVSSRRGSSTPSCTSRSTMCCRTGGQVEGPVGG
jgi:pimeloyl-ACP methyl ester carboxylesterase